MSIDNDPRPGRPRTSTDERSVKLVEDAFGEDRPSTSEVLSRATGVPYLTEDLKNTKISVRRIPLSLTAEQKYKRLDIATLLKERFHVEDQALLRSNCRY